MIVTPKAHQWYIVLAVPSTLPLPVTNCGLCPAGVMDRPADSGVDVSKRAGWDSDRDSNLATLPRPDTGTTA